MIVSVGSESVDHISIPESLVDDSMVIGLLLVYLPLTLAGILLLDISFQNKTTESVTYWNLFIYKKNRTMFELTINI